ncbi:MAG: hypothetical protein KGJ13_09085 [Patescibacteria group bacterium]|nr:hypothetical protein [Patescibacteria group bacterium]
MTITSNDIANQAIQEMGDNQPAVVGEWPSFDTSAAGTALNTFYGPTVETVMRQFEWGFARYTAALVVSGNTAPFPWSYEYKWPTNCIQIWAVIPSSLADSNDPLPTNWVLGNAVVSGIQSRVIHTDLASATAIYNNYPSEDTWDSIFREAVVRLLASVLSLSIAGRPESAQMLLQSGAAFESIGETRVG